MENPCVLRLPRYLEISNPRLRLFYLILMVGMFVFIVLNFLFTAKYTYPNSVETRLRTTFDAGSLDSLIAKNRTAKDTSSFYFCPANTFSDTGTCVGLEEAFVQDGYNNIFLMFSWQGAQTKRKFVPQTESVLIRFDFNYIVHRSQENRWSPWHYFNNVTWWARSSDTVRTRILNHREEEDHVFEANDPIVLPVAKIVELAQGSNPNNFEQKSAGLNPTLRQSGMEITAKVTCNRRSDSDWCDMQFMWVSDQASIKRFVPDKLGRMAPRDYSGLRVHCENGSGTWEELSISGILLCLSSLIVYMSLPKSLISFFTRHCLGQLSRIYTRSLVEPFNVVGDSASAILRMITASLHFVELSQLSSGNELTEQVLMERLHHIMKERGDDLQHGEIEMMARFVQKELLKRKREHRHAFDRIKNSVTEIRKDLMRQDDSIKPRNGLTIDSFSEAMSSIDKVDFSSIVRLFDTDRYRTRLERFFTPVGLSNRLDECRTRGDAVAQEALDETQSLELRKKKQWEVVFKCSNVYDDIQKINTDLRALLHHQNRYIDARSNGTNYLDMEADLQFGDLHQNLNLDGGGFDRVPSPCCFEPHVERADSLGKDVQETLEKYISAQRKLEQYVSHDVEYKARLGKRLAALEESFAVTVDGTHFQTSQDVKKPNDHEEVVKDISRLSETLRDDISRLSGLALQMERQFDVLRKSHENLSKRFEAIMAYQEDADHDISRL